MTKTMGCKMSSQTIAAYSSVEARTSSTLQLGRNRMQFFVIAIVFIIVTNVTAENEIREDSCEEPLSNYSTCDGHGSGCTYGVKIGSCLSCDNSTCDVTQGECFLDLEMNGLNLGDGMYYLTSTLSCEGINKKFCGALNRDGVLCSQCKPGYGPAPYSSATKCFECSSSPIKQWTIYLMLELVPATGFYIVVILFNLRTTAPPCTAIMFFSQLFSLLYKIHPYIRTSLKHNTNTVVLQSVLTLNGFWNLDYFRHAVPSFCISSSLTDLDVIFLECISAFYPLLLVTLTYIFIELHARNFHPVVILWKPISKHLSKCRRKLDPRSSTIGAFATFISLSFNKSLFVTVLFAFPATESILGGQRHYRGMYDPKIHGSDETDYIAHLAHAPYSIPLLFVSIIVHFPILFLLLYPVKSFRRLLTRCGSSRYHAIYVFIDTFQGHYKDGTNGSRDYRAASSISFLLRSLCILLICNIWGRIQVPLFDGNYRAIIYFTMGCSLFYGIVQPCKKKYMNVMESVVYSSTGLILLSLGSLHNLDPSLTSHSAGEYVQIYISLVFLALPSLIVLMTFIVKIFFACKCVQNVWTFLKRCKETNNTNEMNDATADRLEHPQDYETIP